MNLVPYIKACYPILYLATPEESRAEAELIKTAQALKRDICFWSHSEGFFNPIGPKNQKDATFDPIAALGKCQSETASVIFVLRDLHLFMGNPKVSRLIRDIARDFKQNKKTLVLLSAVYKVPVEVERDVTLIDFLLPRLDEIKPIFDGLYAGGKKKIGPLDTDELERIYSAALGMTTTEAENAFAKAMVEFVTDKESGVQPLLAISHRVMIEKALAVRKGGILEYTDKVVAASDVGGLSMLKGWLTMRSKAYTAKARSFKLKMPRGILLIGMPGCGKSLTAKAAATILGAPLVRLDIGRVFAGLVGESETNIRRVIQTVEALGLCVLWIDEMEKAFAGMSNSSSGDSGTSQRVFSNFLTWLQEKTCPAFVVATVNNLGSLPPELFRKGRFDEIFFIGLPTKAEREAIIRIHVAKVGRDVAKVFADGQLAEFVASTKGFSGAEIEECVTTAMFNAFHHERELAGTDIIAAAKLTNPLSNARKSELETMAAWAMQNAFNASADVDDELALATGGRSLDLN